jgi:hypothetical protein
MVKRAGRCIAFFPKECPIFMEIVKLNPGKGTQIVDYIRLLLKVPPGTEACYICGAASKCEAVWMLSAPAINGGEASEPSPRIFFVID